MLLYSMAEAMTEAIDKRTPYNASHTRKVSAYSVQLAEYVNQQYKKKRTKIHLTKNEIEQLRLASLLHDVGKMIVPKNVLDKPSRFGGYMNDMIQRFEKISLLYQLDCERKVISEKEAEEKLTELKDIQDFITVLDKKEWVSPEEKEKIAEIITKEYAYPDGEKLSYFTEKEIECMYIAKGTLTAEEMELVHSHAIHTDGILERIRFGKNYADVRHIAASHHELLNGKGYPNHLKGEEISVPIRILTIADVYDALTADDRPYKKAKSIEQSLKILGFMVKDGEVDGELFKFAEELWGENIKTEDKNDKKSN